MASEVVESEKKYYKLPAANRMPGLTKYKDYKIVAYYADINVDEGDAGNLVLPLCTHRFDRDGAIVGIFAGGNARFVDPQAASGGLVVDWYLVNQVIFLADMRLAVGSKLATDSGYRSDVSHGILSMPGLLIPITEDDTITLGVGFTDLAAANPGTKGSEAAARFIIHYIEL